MIHSLKTRAFFPISGASLSGDFQPSSGITAVVGENGAGKTFMSIEALRWCLYGKAALRGAAPDYRQAEVEADVSIGGARYRISRGRNEWVKDGSGAMVAKGAEQVTAYITAAMGYGLDVFDLCNAATQGRVQRLGELRPAERKAMIDSVLKLTDAERAEKDCRDEAKGYRREVEALTKSLRAPGDEPVAPFRYDLDDMRAALASMRRERDEAAALRSRRRETARPAMPVVGEFSEEGIQALECYVAEQRALHARHRDLTVAAGGASWSAEELDAADARLRIRKALDARGSRPVTSIEDVEAGWAAHHAFDAHKASEPVECPSCHHVFRPTGDAPVAPAYTKEWLRAEAAAHARWPDDGPVLPDGLDLTNKQIAAGRAALDARTALAALPPLGPDRQGMLNTMLRDKAALEAFTTAQLQFERAEEANAVIDAELAALEPVPNDEMIDSQSDALRRAEVHDAALRAWRADDAAFRDTQAKIIEAQRLADEFKKGAEKVADARAVVKALIAPKISRIATVLLRDMSAGVLTELTVDDEMEITVNGQRIETLSGAGKTVANLALRVAMGQALVGRVFPVFLADEIDGDLSVKRREATLQALVSLKKHLQQIILVTHRGADVADAVWDVTG